MIQYSGGTLINRTGTPTTKQALCDLITLALSDAGWTTISGVPGSGADVTLETAAANQGQKIRYRFVDLGGGTVTIQVNMKAASGFPSGGACYILPNSVLWRVIANKYHFFAFMSTSANRAIGRGAVMGGTLYVPSFIPLPSSENVGWMIGGGISDTDVAARSSFRTTIRSYDNSGTGGRCVGIFQSGILDTTGYTSNNGPIGFCVWQGGYNTSDLMFRWHDDSAFVYEPLMAWGTSAVSDEAKIRGQLYDAMIVSGRYIGEYSLPYDGKNWRGITDNANTGIAADQTLFLAVP